MNLFFITGDRLIAIWRPFQYVTLVRKSLVIGTICAAAILSFASFSVSVVAALLQENDRGFCMVYYKVSSFAYKAGKYVMMLDTIILIVVYSYILYVLRTNKVDHNVTSIQTGTRRATMTSLWIIATFMLCYWPDVISGYVKFPIPLYVIAKGLPFINCLSDPLIYALRLRKIRAGYILMFKKFPWCPCTALDNPRAVNNIAMVTSTYYCH
jgi:hypothetical protein